MNNTVYLAPCRAYESEAARKALEQVITPTGFFEKVLPGTRVVIKANLVSMMKPEKAATTHPVLLSELTRMLTERGASVVIGDSPGGLFTSAYVNQVYRACGLSAAEEAGAVLNQNFETHACRDEAAAAAKDFVYTSYLDDRDLLVNFCKLKTHGMMGMSASVKNMFGSIPGTTKPEYHYRFPDPEDFSDMLVDLNEHFHADLNLVDAVTGMEGNGPTAGTPRSIGCVLACTSPYPLDLACAKIIGLPADQIPTVRASIRRGKVRDIDDFSVEGDLQAFCIPDYELVVDRSGFDFSGNGSAFGKLRGAVLRKLLSSRPELSPDLCIGCGKCRDICPARAIRMEDKKPVIDRRTCIRCFCCQEFCPRSAMKVHRTAIARLLQ